MVQICSQGTWEINYREAAIFLEEGQNNDKFIYHPRSVLEVDEKNQIMRNNL